MKISKRQLKRIIREEKTKILSEQGHEMYSSDDELRELGDVLSELIAISTHAEAVMNDMGYRYGELVALGTHARTVKKSAKELSNTYAVKLDDILKFR